MMMVTANKCYQKKRKLRKYEQRTEETYLDTKGCVNLLCSCSPMIMDNMESKGFRRPFDNTAMNQ